MQKSCYANSVFPGTGTTDSGQIRLMDVSRDAWKVKREKYADSFSASGSIHGMDAEKCM